VRDERAEVEAARMRVVEVQLQRWLLRRLRNAAVFVFAVKPDLARERMLGRRLRRLRGLVSGECKAGSEGARGNRRDAESLMHFLGFLLDSGAQVVERQVERQDVDGGLAEKAKLAFLRVLLHQLAHFRLGEAAHLRDASDLVLGGGRRDMRIETRAGSGDEI